MEDFIDKDDIINTIPLDTSNQQIANDIIAETSFDKTQELIRLFNLNQAKKNALRVLKLNNLLDKVQDSMIERFEKRPGEFSNTDLINYMNTVQNAIDRANKSLNLIDEAPAITLNQVNVNVEDPVLNRESREKITNAINALLKLNLNNEQKEEEIIIEEKGENDEANN